MFGRKSEGNGSPRTPVAPHSLSPDAQVCKAHAADKELLWSPVYWILMPTALSLLWITGFWHCKSTHQAVSLNHSNSNRYLAEIKASVISK